MICKKIWCNRNCFKNWFKKTAEATGILIGNKVADQNRSASKSSKNLHLQSNLDEKNRSKEGYISSEKRQQTIEELLITRLI